MSWTDTRYARRVPAGAQGNALKSMEIFLGCGGVPESFMPLGGKFCRPFTNA
jgi:hypothetical protein